MTEPGVVEPSAVSVVIATYLRPDVLRECLGHLMRQTVTPHEILVVDASPDTKSREITGEFPTVRYLRNDEGEGTLPRSRQIGLAETTGEVLAFLDDDAYADPEWLEQLAATYREGVGGVGGQARNDQPDEETTGVDQIGKFFPDGTLTGNFAADPGKTIEVDHLIGCNMSYRRSVLIESGGIPAWPAGVSALREDLLLSLRVTATGTRLLFNPRAGVLHIGAPQARGQRFDLRYEFNGHRNHMFVLVAHFGLADPIVRRYVVTLVRDQSWRVVRGSAALLLRSLWSVGGAAVGLRRGVEFHRSRNR